MKIIGMNRVSKGKIIATADVQLSDDITINQFKIQRDQDGSLFVTEPVLHWVENRQHFFTKAVGLSNDLLGRINHKIIEYYETLEGMKL